MAFYRNILYQNNIPIQGVEARLYLGDAKVGCDTTDYHGKYRFDDLENGNYQIRFFGEDFTEDDYINFSIAGETPLIDFVGIPNLAVAEGNPIFEEQGEISTGLFSLTSLTTKTGNIRTILIENKESIIGTDWNLIKRFNFSAGLDGVSDDLGSAIFAAPVTLLETPIQYDFRATFFNGDKVPAKTDSGEMFYSNDLNITFNGIADFEEYVGVSGVIVRNANIVGNVLPTNEIMLTWDDPRKTEIDTYIDAAGNETYPTKYQIENMTGYIIYMFISNSGDPPSGGEEYPVKTETNGAWYLLATIPANTPEAKIRLPQKKKILLWIGFQTSGVEDKTGAPKLYYVF